GSSSYPSDAVVSGITDGAAGTLPPPSGQADSASLPTAAGTGVTVRPSPLNNAEPTSLPGVAMTFANVSDPWATSSRRRDRPSGAPPATGGAGSTNFYFDISTTASFSGSVDVDLPYDPTGLDGIDVVTSPVLHLLHYENGIWVDRTATVDPARHVI